MAVNIEYILNNFKADFVKITREREVFTSYIFNTGNPEICFTRQRKLGLAELLWFIIYPRAKSTEVELMDYFGEFSIERTPTKGALSQRRKIVDADIFLRLNSMLVPVLRNGGLRDKWHGLSMVAFDGTTVTLPDTPELREKYGCPAARGNRKANPQARVVYCYDVRNRIFLGAMALPYQSSERSAVLGLIDALPECYKKDTVFLFDRGYPSYYLMDQIDKRNLYFFMRMPSNAFRPAWEFAGGDSDAGPVVFERPARFRPGVQTRGEVDFPLLFHAVRTVLPGGETEVCVHNLRPGTAAYADAGRIYPMRWKIETAIGEEKNQFQVEVFSSKRENGVLQDLYASMVAYNLLAPFLRAADEMAGQRRRHGKHAEMTNRNIALAIFRHFFPLLVDEHTNLGILTLCVKRMTCFLEPIIGGRRLPHKRRHQKSNGKYVTMSNYRRSI